jgi:RHS repeat-associated protein
MPFGEEISDGGRSVQQGYVDDGVKQKFTGYERDDETGLDYAKARYYASMQGRFTSADPINTIIAERAVDPQQINLYVYARNNPLKFIDSTGMKIDPSKLGEEDRKDWDEIVGLANAKDELGDYLNPQLHAIYQRLDADERTFVIENHSFGDRSTTIGKFKITKFNGANDFSEAVLQLDFNKSRNQTEPSRAELVPGFKKFQGLFGVKNEAILRLAELFGHEGSHGMFALNDLAGATKLQRLLNDRDAAMNALPKGTRFSDFPPDVKQLMDAADKGLVPTERFAQQGEEKVNYELNPALRRVTCKKK